MSVASLVESIYKYLKTHDILRVAVIEFLRCLRFPYQELPFERNPKRKKTGIWFHILCGKLIKDVMQSIIFRRGCVPGRQIFFFISFFFFWENN